MSSWGAKSVAMGFVFTLFVAGGAGGFIAWQLSRDPAVTPPAPAVAWTPTAPPEQPREFILLPPLPPPEELPLVGQEGTDDYGYPLQRVDAIALQSALRHRRFDDLARFFAEIDRAYREDCRKERWLADALDAFDSADPRLTEPLDAWVAAQPDSAAPLLARGTHRRSIAWQRRGGGTANTVNEAQQAQFQAHLASAKTDLDAALRMDSHQLAGWVALFNVVQEQGDGPGARAAIAGARAECPRCMGPHEALLRFLTPRWGGSYAAMDALALEARAMVGENPALAALSGFSHEDRCHVERVAQRYDTALAACNQALAAGAHPLFWAERSELFAQQERFQEALTDAEAALRTKAQSPGGLRAHYHALAGLNRYAEAAEAFRTLAYLDPMDQSTLDMVPHVAGTLTFGANQLANTHRDAALGLLDDALTFLPGHGGANDVLRYMLQSQTHGSNPNRNSLEQVQARALAEPDNFHAQRDYDAALMVASRVGEIVPIWDAYIERHPLEGRAYRERMGTYHHLGNITARHHDAVRGCELGDAVACRYAQ